MATPVTPDVAANAVEKTIDTDAVSESSTSFDQKRSEITDEKTSKKRKWFKRKDSSSEDKDNSSIAIDAPAAPKPATFLQLFKYATRFEIMLNILGLFFALGSGVTQPVLSIVFGRMVTDMTNFFQVSQLYTTDPTAPGVEDAFNKAASDLNDQVSLNCIYLVAIGAAMFIGSYSYTVIYTYTSERIARRIREMYLRSVLRQDIAFFDEIGAGEIATRIESDCHLLHVGISDKVATASMYIATFITGFIIAFVRQAKLAGVMFIIVPCIAVLGGVMTAFTSKYQASALDHIAFAGTLAEEVISTIRTAKAFGSQLILGNLYDDQLLKARKVGYKSASANASGIAVMFFILYSSYSIAFCWGTTLILRGEADTGKIVSVFMSILIGAFSLAMINPELQAIGKGRGAAAKIYDTIERVPSIDSSSDDGLKPATVEGNISFSNVNFAYPARKEVQVMKDFTAVFPKGQLTALVGASGSGKSTSISLIERFYDPLSGDVMLDGVNLKDLNVKWLRSKIGLVGQEPVLFNDTVRANVEHGLIGTEMEHWPDEQRLELVINACKVANADGFINTLPEKYNNSVGERGMLLSGGQKQRVAIARAIVSDPPILLLDEATAALDSASESIVQKALDQAAMNRTTVAIAHRLSTIKNAHQIIVMGGGEILEVGNHATLTANAEGAYSTLVAAQSLSQAKSAEAAQAKEENEDLKDSTPNEDVLPLDRVKSSRSVASLALEKRSEERGEFKEKHYSFFRVLVELIKINKDARWMYAIGAVAAFFSGAVYPSGFAVVFGRVIQNLSLSPSSPNYHEQMRHNGDRDALYFFVIAIGATIAIYIQSLLMHSAGEMLTYILRHKSFAKLLRSDVEYFDKKENSTGVLTSELSSNSQKVQGLAGVTMGTIVQSCSTLIVGIAVGIGHNWKLGLIGTACIPLTLSAGITRLRVVVLKDKRTKAAYERSSQYACEGAASIRTVASLTREDQISQFYHDTLSEPYEQSVRSAIFSSALFALGQTFTFWVLALVFWYGSRQLTSLEVDVQGFYVTLMSVIFSSIQAGNVFSFVPDISSARGGAARILNLLNIEPEIEVEHDDSDGKHLDSVDGHITFEDVHFRYPTRADVPVLRSLNLEIKPGSYVALVGPSGCGKSTTIQLIERFYDPLAGSVKLDGHEVRDLNLNNLRSHMALVSQEPTLYAGTVKYNILMGATRPHEEISQQELEDACADANILDFVRDLPDGFETQVGGKGTQLSGGQKQRIAIARALIRKPKILLLDEATSALDQTSEAVVQAALDKVASGRTTIAIAHRLSTIQKADMIYVFKDGKVSQAGTHKELIEQKDGLYAELVALQSLSKQDA
ncbi:hypothetical protein E3P99_00799 [Wallemia hederae]|uniref:Leptomycin B resistance protein pmd1 n=1 Tax=Wallemia hederae TaxID=1540922 RepID=A0A4T0FY63_9BASI|nr:hypothetical protein E3P99_00799 [Wallemia hederae]